MALRSDNDAVGSNTVVIGADTVVELDGEVLEKPRDAEHAKEMLRKLSGTAHAVHTGEPSRARSRSDGMVSVAVRVGASDLSNHPCALMELSRGVTESRLLIEQ